MTCNRITARLDDYLDGDVSAELHRVLQTHVAQCAECRTVVAQARRLQSALAAHPVEGPASDFFDRALARAQQAAAPVRPRGAWTVGVSSALAAGLAVLVVGGLFMHKPQMDPTAPNPAQQAAPGLSGVSLAMHETRTVNLVFSAAAALEGVSLTVDLPAGVELAGYTGLGRVSWRTRLVAGKNVLPLDLVAVSGAGGELVARLQHDDDEKVFTLSIAVVSG